MTAAWFHRRPTAAYFADHVSRFAAYDATETTFFGETSGAPLPVGLALTEEAATFAKVPVVLPWNDAGGTCLAGVYTPGAATAEHTKYRQDTPGFMRDLEVYFGAPWAGERLLAAVDGQGALDQLIELFREKLCRLYFEK